MATTGQLSLQAGNLRMQIQALLTYEGFRPSDKKVLDKVVKDLKAFLDRPKLTKATKISEGRATLAAHVKKLAEEAKASPDPKARRLSRAIMGKIKEAETLTTGFLEEIQHAEGYEKLEILEPTEEKDEPAEEAEEETPDEEK